MIYTAYDVPFWAMSGAITQDTVERNSVIMFPRFIGTTGAAIATVATLPLIYLFRDILGGNTVGGYQLTALTYGLITIVTFLIAFFFVKERVPSKKHAHASLRQTLWTFSRNKPLLLIIISGFLSGVATTSKLQILIFYSEYVLHNEALYIVLVGINIPFILLGIALVPAIAKRLGREKNDLYSILRHLYHLQGVFWLLFLCSSTPFQRPDMQKSWPS